MDEVVAEIVPDTQLQNLAFVFKELGRKVISL
jgi:hypothetical protein